MDVKKYVSTSSHGGMVAVVANDYSHTYVRYEDYAALQDTLAARDRELAEYKAAMDAEGSPLFSARYFKQKCEVAEQALAEARRDAERYRLLRRQPVEGGPWGTPRIAIPETEYSGDFVNEEDADAAIDAAIEQEKGDAA